MRMQHEVMAYTIIDILYLILISQLTYVRISENSSGRVASFNWPVLGVGGTVHRSDTTPINHSRKKGS